MPSTVTVMRDGTIDVIVDERPACLTRLRLDLHRLSLLRERAARTGKAASEPALSWALPQ